MDLGKQPDGLVEASSNPRAEECRRGPISLPTEDDEIPLDSSSEESQSSSAAMSDSDSEGEESPLISTGNEHIPNPATQPNSVVAHVPSFRQSQDISRKRKSLERADTVPDTAIPNKKVKLDEKGVTKPSSIAACLSEKSPLPPEIWHRIFTFTPPRTLGNLLCVNKLFNVYLDPSSRYQCKPPPSLSQSSVPLLKPDTIWQLSRRRFWPRMPAPLQQKTELDMWRLACGRSCQFCGKVDSTSLGSPSEQRRHKLQSVWPFALRSCGICLIEKTVKEIELLLSSSMPSLLISALPFVLITGETVVLSLDALQKGVVQPDPQVTKIYLSDHAEALKQEFLAVKSMGGATAEEWLKGLEARGKYLLSDSMRWEKWASAGGVVQMQTLLTPDSLPNSTALSGKGSDAADSSASGSRPDSNSSSMTGQDMPSSSHTAPIMATASQPTRPAATRIQNDPVTRIPSSLQYNLQPNAPRARTREEALELKAARRTEIERRAMELDPPLPANVLAHIPSFQAAIQIISPLDDNAWDLLKPRLLAQRADAEQLEQRAQVTTQPLTTSERPKEHNTEENSILTKQLVDKAWDEVQAPLRARISAYADEIIRDTWDEGRKVDIENSPQFAAEVLLHVRSKFYAEITKESAAKCRAGQEPNEDPPEGPFTSKLTLENMKWLFDVKIKPHTEPYRKDLFFCNGCEVSIKAFGFEGVIQHYAAKHTSTLSLGSIVVHWRAEWPETPPFKADPRAVKSMSQPTASSYGTLQPQNTVPYNQHNTSVYSSASISTPLQTPTYFNAQPPNYGHPMYGPAAHMPAPYSQGNPYAPGQHDYGSHYPPHPSPYIPQGTTYPNSQVPFSPAVYPGPPSFPPTADVYPGHNFDARQSNSIPNFTDIHGNSPAGKYHAQLEYLARSSRELWNSTAGLKELPGNVRVCVVIHHITRRFRSRFSESPPLTMFIDGLSNNKEMRPVRNVNGLMCKACYINPVSGVSADQDRKTFSLPQLVNHFQQRHIDQPQTTGAPSLDWTVGMVHAPDLSVLSNPLYLTNVDSQKLSLIFDAFPTAQYPSSYPPGWPSAGPQNTGPGAATTPYPGQQPTYDTPASHHAPQYDSSTIHAVARHDVFTLGGHQDATRATALSKRADIDQLIIGGAPPLPGLREPQRDDSGRASPPSWQGYNGSKPKRRHGTSAQGQRSTPGQGFRNRKGNVGGTPARIKSQEPSDQDLVAEDERRQGEEIKAMWAADRREAARLASIDQRPIRSGESKVSIPILETEHPISPFSPIAPSPRSPTRPTRIPNQQQTITTQEHDEDDLMAGLESQLDQQQVQSEHFEYRSRHPNNPISENPPLYEWNVNGGEYIHSNQRRPYDQVHPEHRTCIRQESVPYLSRSRERSPGSRPVDLAHAPARSTMAQHSALYDRHSRQDYHQAYIEQARQPTEMYELIPARDSHGEYFIRRPVKLEGEPAYVTLHDGRPPYGETEYRTYNNDRPPSSHRGYDSTTRINTPLRQTVYEDDTSMEAIARGHPYGPRPRDNHSMYEEYDPRFPAGPPGPSIAQQARYR